MRRGQVMKRRRMGSLRAEIKNKILDQETNRLAVARYYNSYIDSLNLVVKLARQEVPTLTEHLVSFP